jgi:hypothetical protein
MHKIVAQLFPPRNDFFAADKNFVCIDKTVVFVSRSFVASTAYMFHLDGGGRPSGRKEGLLRRLTFSG